MKKKLISLFLIGAMTTGMVAGCGSGNSNAGRTQEIKERVLHL